MSGTQVTPVDARPPALVLKEQIATRAEDFAAALPPHIPVARFVRVVQTAVASNPALAQADRRSLFEAAMKAAQDGLLPDGREGAFVVYRSKSRTGGREEWVDKVQWMPMIGGLLKKVRNSGELLSIGAHVVCEHDTFDYRLGDDETLRHEPKLDGDRGVPRLVYAIARTKDGGVYREVMTVAEIERVRSVSRAKDSGPWKDWWEEMAKKTVIRRLSKRLPMSSDLDDLLRRDDELYDFGGKAAGGEEVVNRLAVRTSLAERLSAVPSGARGAGFVLEHVDAETAAALDDEPVDAAPEPVGAQEASAGGAGSGDDRTAAMGLAYALHEHLSRADTVAGLARRVAEWRKANADRFASWPAEWKQRWIDGVCALHAKVQDRELGWRPDGTFDAAMVDEAARRVIEGGR